MATNASIRPYCGINNWGHNNWGQSKNDVRIPLFASRHFLGGRYRNAVIHPAGGSDLIRE